MRTFILYAFIIFLCGCQSLSLRRIRADNQDEMIAVVNKRIPLGTRLSEARKTMEEAGFECTFLTEAWFTEDPGFIDGDRERYRSIEDARYLSCERGESDGFLVSHLWTVAIVVDEHDNVKDVLVLHRMEGPLDNNQMNAEPGWSLKAKAIHKWVGVTCTVFSVVVGVASVIVAANNAECSFKNPVLAAITFGVFWCLFSLLGVYLWLFSQKYRPPELQKTGQQLLLSQQPPLAPS